MKPTKTVELGDIKFPKDIKFEKITNGFKINSTGGKFFPNKLGTPLIVSFIIIWILACWVLS